MKRITVAGLFLGLTPIFAELTTDQRIADFQAVAGVYHRYYAPASWKILALGVNIFDLKPWTDRIRAAKSDVEYLQICAEYVGSFRDGHSEFSTASTYVAQLGLFVDIYDGKALLESVDRSQFPLALYPFRIGDEIVSIDGVPALDVVRELSKVITLGTPRSTLRLASAYLFFRPQAAFPLAVNLGDTATVVIRDADGVESSYSLPWRRSGFPLRSLPGIPASRISRSVTPSSAESGPSLRNYTGVESFQPDRRGAFSRTLVNDDGETVNRGDLIGWGRATPYYGLPAGFVRRRNGTTDFFYSGTYTADGQRIGYIRIPNFAPASEAASIREFENEILFFRDNTDGLVVDLSRNTGGGCVGVEWATRLMPTQFQIVQRQYRPWFDMVSAYDQYMGQLRQAGAPRWVIETYQYISDSIALAATVPGAMTGEIPRCNLAGVTGLSAPSQDQLPARNATGIIAYDKPIVFLGDDLSASFADSFLADMQDNKRGLIVGTRTSGLGGSISQFPGGPLSESSTSVTVGINLRGKAVGAPGLPTSRYIENTGVLPDVELDYMTRENLMNGGRPFVEGFTGIIVQEIRKSKGL